MHHVARNCNKRKHVLTGSCYCFLPVPQPTLIALNLPFPHLLWAFTCSVPPFFNKVSLIEKNPPILSDAAAQCHQLGLVSFSQPMTAKWQKRIYYLFVTLNSKSSSNRCYQDQKIPFQIFRPYWKDSRKSDCILCVSFISHSHSKESRFCSNSHGDLFM